VEGGCSGLQDVPVLASRMLVKGVSIPVIARSVFLHAYMFAMRPHDACAAILYCLGVNSIPGFLG
jgi:hypothetical protein